MLGTALTEVAVREGTDVYAIIRKNTKRIDRIISSPLVHIVYGSLENLEEIQELPTDCDVFYHFAWAGTSKAERDDPEIHEKNVKYTLAAVNLAYRTGCHRFVGAGSQAEYGPVYGRIDENTPFAPKMSYGIAKYAAGILSRILCEKKNISHIWGRVFSVYGPHDNEGTMLEYAIKCWNRGETAHFSEATQMWNYLYESDAGEMFYKFGCEEIPAGTYFVANKESIVLREYIEILMEAYGDRARADFSEAHNNPSPGLDVDMGRTFQLLDYTPKVDFNTGIRNMISSISSY